MNYKEFLIRVKENIQKYLPSEYAKSEPEIIRRHVNNSENHYGITIRRMDKNIAPLLDLAPYYKMFENGTAFDSILRKLAATYYIRDTETPTLCAEDFLYDNVKDKIFVKVCNAEKNKKQLANAPHELKGDVALKYYIRGDKAADETIQINIHKGYLELWNITEEELKEQAWSNMRNLDYPVIIKISHLLESYEEEELGEQELSDSGLYLLTNSRNRYGASYAFDEKVMELISTTLNDDVVIIPSSVNEALFISKKIVEEYEVQRGIKALIEEINVKYLRDEEFLSNEIYMYDRNTHQFSIIDVSEQEMGMSMNM